MQQFDLIVVKYNCSSFGADFLPYVHVNNFTDKMWNVTFKTGSDSNQRSWVKVTDGPRDQNGFQRDAFGFCFQTDPQKVLDRDDFKLKTIQHIQRELALMIKQEKSKSNAVTFQMKKKTLFLAKGGLKTVLFSCHTCTCYTLQELFTNILNDDDTDPNMNLFRSRNTVGTPHIRFRHRGYYIGSDEPE